MRALLVLFIFASGCSTVAQSLSPSTVYKRDISIGVNGVTGVGAVIVPKSASYKIELKLAKGNFDFTIFDTCAKFYSLPEDQGSDLETVFVPRVGVEDHGSCPIRIHSFDKDHSRDAFGFIAFKSPEFNLPATLECNDQPRVTDTVTYCENKDGDSDPKIVKLSFSEPVYWASSKKMPGCVLPEPVDGKTFIFSTGPQGDCEFLFEAKSDPLKKHLLYTHWFREILPRKF